MVQHASETLQPLVIKIFKNQWFFVGHRVLSSPFATLYSQESDQ
jgi:hypothetical protein